MMLSLSGQCRHLADQQRSDGDKTLAIQHHSNPDDADSLTAKREGEYRQYGHHHHTRRESRQAP